uniref:Uncharacterized protein n=1 Tax=Myotis myotis TaxID=51298 RepID=A0A7J8AME9_MYOMY|nr:hypothetical protein mMyoMyo1_008038 [Myotis myotis]
MLRLSHHSADRQLPYLSLHQPGSHCLLFPGDSLKPCHIQTAAALPYECPVLAQASDFPKISQTCSTWPQHAPYLSISGPRLSSLPRFTDWPLLGTSKPNTSSSHLQIAVLGGPRQVTSSNCIHTSQEAPEPVYLVVSFRPHQITTLPHL